MKQEEKDRLDARISAMMACKTPEELAYNIWTPELEKAMGDRSAYRKPFINWVECYKSGEKPQWRYKTPMELAEGIWVRFAKDDEWINSVRNALVDWIEQYAIGSSDLPY